MTPSAEIRLKYVATLNSEALGENTDPDYELQYIDIGNVDSSGHVREVSFYRFAEAPSRARRRVRHGDVIVSCVRTYLQAIAPIESPPNNLIVSTGFAVVRPTEGKLRPGFCKYALREPRFLAEVERRSVGVSYPAINSSDLAAIPIAAQPDGAQIRIEEFLDRETARLDALVAAKQCVLDLLAEKRKAIIAAAATRGLDSKAKLRDSGVPWLGEIPAHWVVTRMKFVASVQTGIALGKDYSGQATTEYAYLRVANVQDGFLDLTELKTMAVPAREAASAMLRSGDVLMNEGGDVDKLGRGAIWDGAVAPCIHQNHVFALRPKSVTSAWLSAWTGAAFAKAYFETRAKQSTNLASISSTNLLELPIAVPPDAEQRAIVEHIAGKTAKLDAVCAATERTVALLKERRSALIAAAVTGQLDVTTRRGTAA